MNILNHPIRRDPRNYAAVAVYHADRDQPSLLADSKGRVVVFDNAQTAYDFIPLLGNGRLSSWSEDNETVFYHPIEEAGINRVSIVTDYDIYNLPPGLPHLSETKLRKWKNHVIWSEYAREAGFIQ